MKKRLLLIPITAIMLTACDLLNGIGNTETVPVQVTAETTQTETTAETFADMTLFPTTETETTAETEAAPEPEYEYAQVSEGNVFIDYYFLEDCPSTDVSKLGTLGAKAVAFLSESEYYAKSHENIDLFKKDDNIDRFRPYFDEGGNILPKVSGAYSYDYDGDGRNETFLLVDMPYVIWEYPTERSFLIFADSEENMTILDNFSNMNPVQLLDYGDFKQIAFGSFGIGGADEGSVLYGVIGGQAEELYGGRCGFYKSGCFLSTFGWQGSGDFMYYDTVAKEYRAIVGENIAVDEVKALDADNTLAEYYDYYDENGYLGIKLVGKRYYIFSHGFMDEGTAYVYENGKFIQTDDCQNVRLSPNIWELPEVRDIDINAAYAEMVKIK